MTDPTPFAPRAAAKTAQPPRTAPVLLLLMALLAAFALLMTALPSGAQEALPEAPLAGATPGGTDAAGQADSDIWREIRQGGSGTVAGQNPLGGTLIQSEGHTWELTRNGPLAMYSAWLLLGMIGLLGLFFALRGRIRIDSGLSGIMIRRFSSIETTGHWLLATSFIILALTGLNLLFGRELLMPLIGKEAFATLTAWGKYIHNYVAFAFMVSLVMIFVMWVVHNIPRPSDLVWLIRGGGLFGGGHPPARKFNAGQKLIFWSVILCGVSISLSGWALLNPFDTGMFAATFVKMNAFLGTSLPTDLSPIQEQQYQQIWHTVMSVLLMTIVIAHIYIGSIGMQGAAGAMTHGEVDLNWAREHHSIWVEEMEAQEDAERRAGRPSATPAE